VVPIPCEIPCARAALLALGLWTARHDGQKYGDGNADRHGDEERDKASC
jgi:hypothetical protein